MEIQMQIKLSPQAIGALLMTLQKCLSEETDITELLADWNLTVRDDLVYVVNPPTVSTETTNEENKFEVE
tara:strand:- start:4818 stop:5027 length:210 start_codon:yes stop_codon:yes gene_type:complete